MNKTTLFCAAALFSSLSVAQAAEVTVQFKPFNDYQDVHPSNETRGSFHKRVAGQFEKHLQKLAEQLPDGYSLKVNFDEIDLAGDVHYGIQEIRVVKPIHFPRLTISYQIKDKAGNVVLESAETKLKDMAFMERSRLGRDEAFYFDKRLLTEWFTKDVLPQIMVKNS
jgi:hypothetical protein